jgi:hypothetical protein
MKEFVKKYWIWILVAVIIIAAVIIYLKKKPGTGTLLGKGKGSQATSHAPGTIGNAETISAIKTIIKQGVTSLNDLKQKAFAKGGYSVYSQAEASTIKFSGKDPKRVIVDEKYNIVSVGY